MELNQEPTRRDTIECAYATGQLVADYGDFYDVVANIAIGYRDNHIATAEPDSPPPAYTGDSQIRRPAVADPEPNSTAARIRRARESERHWIAMFAALNEIRSVAESLIQEAVGEARRDGMTWEQIGDALEVTKQAAQKRYGPNIIG